jgi:hypothetical protein
MEQAVRSICLLLPVFVAAITSAAADAPFAPIANVSDYVVTMVERGFQSEEPRPRIVSHHRNWTRVDSVDQPFGAAVPYNVSAFFSTHRKTEIRVYRSDLIVQMIRGSEPSPWREMAPRNTGERQSHLGESCTVWDVWRVASDPTGGLTHLSCITDDGIELWHKSVGRHGVLGSAEAVRVERRSVAPAEVRPTPRLLVPDWWTSDLGEATEPEVPDHEIIVTSETGALRTSLRHGAWQSVEETLNGVRQLRVSHSGVHRPALECTSDKTGAPKRLTITRPVPTDAVLPGSTPADLNQTETVLGESCRWFDMWPGTLDGGLHFCRTDDGIVLKESRRTNGTTTGWTAVRLARRPVRLDEIKHPDILHNARVWGIQ